MRSVLKKYSVLIRVSDSIHKIKYYFSTIKAKNRYQWKKNVSWRRKMIFCSNKFYRRKKKSYSCSQIRSQRIFCLKNTIFSPQSNFSIIGTRYNNQRLITQYQHIPTHLATKFVKKYRISFKPLSHYQKKKKKFHTES